MAYSIQGKTVLVTGTNRGIGEALVKELVAQGAGRIYATARNPASLEALVAQAPGVVVPVQLDVNDANSIAKLAKEITSLDILINNAGIVNSTTFSGEDALAIAAAEMATNYFGPVNLTHALLPVLHKSQAAAVVNISSVAGLANFPSVGPYSASKAAVHSFTQGLRAELRKANIFVQGVYPGPVDTDMTKGWEMEKATPAEVAKNVLVALQKGEEDVYPDAFAQQMFQVYSQNPKQLEQQFAATLG